MSERKRKERRKRRIRMERRTSAGFWKGEKRRGTWKVRGRKEGKRSEIRRVRGRGKKED